jgi:hypothetical protein
LGGKICFCTLTDYVSHMRLICLLACLGTPALAWEAYRDGPICLLEQSTSAGNILVSHDPRKAQPYAIQLRRTDEPWAGGPVFAIRFDGPGRSMITTDRHQILDEGAKLVVTDSGFENVLRGLEQNFVALATLGNQTMILPLDGAAPEVAQFRSCSVGAGV